MYLHVRREKGKCFLLSFLWLIELVKLMIEQLGKLSELYHSELNIPNKVSDEIRRAYLTTLICSRTVLSVSVCVQYD